MVPPQSRRFPCNIIIYICTALIQGERTLQCLKAFGANIFFNLKYVREKNKAKKNLNNIKAIYTKWQTALPKTPLTKSQDALSLQRSSRRCFWLHQSSCVYTEGRRHLQALRRARVLAQLWGGEALERPELLVQPQQVHLIYGASKTVLHSQLVEQHTLSRHGHLLLLHLTVGEHLLHVHHQLEKRRRQTVHFCYVASESHAISSPTELVLIHNPSTKHHILWLQSRAYFDIQCLHQITIGLRDFNALPGFDCLELNRDFE